MYTRILVPLENSKTDEAIVTHVRSLSEHCRASIVLIHVADGFAARNINSLELRESEEIKKDRAYLDGVAAKLSSAGYARGKHRFYGVAGRRKFRGDAVEVRAILLDLL